MSYRFMRVLVLFDLPVLTGDQRREYARFQKFLLKADSCCSRNPYTVSLR